MWASIGSYVKTPLDLIFLPRKEEKKNPILPEKNFREMDKTKDISVKEEALEELIL